jgi:hypothetical protein
MVVPADLADTTADTNFFKYSVFFCYLMDLSGFYFKPERVYLYFFSLDVFYSSIISVPDLLLLPFSEELCICTTDGS